MATAINWDETYQQALEYFKALIRIPTINPPGNEKPAAEFIAEILRQEGLEPAVLESGPHRANVVARLKGTGEKPPLLLNGHLDVSRSRSPSGRSRPLTRWRRTACSMAGARWT